jgi:outer membrane protein TolC
VINLTVRHGRTLEDARRRLETAVQQVSAQFGAMVRRVEWSADRSRVKLEGVGAWVELWVDAQDVHVTGDLSILGNVLGGPLTAGLKQIVQQTFQKHLP